MNKKLTALLVAICLIMAPLNAFAATKAYAKFTKKTYQVKKGKSLDLRSKLKLSEGNTVKKWKSSNPKIAKISSKGKLVAKKAGTVKITVITKSGKKATCKVKVKAIKSSKLSKSNKSSSESSDDSDGIVYWTSGGSVYHTTDSCPTLGRSRNIQSGTVAESGKSRACKVCG